MSLAKPTTDEERLVAGWARGEVFDGAGSAVIDAAVIRALLGGADPAWPVAPGALCLRGAKLTGALELRAIRSRADGRPMPRFEAENCTFDGPVDLEGAVIAGIVLRRCVLPALWATEADIEGSLDLSGSVLQGRAWRGDGRRAAVHARGARIRGDLVLRPAYGPAGGEDRRFEAQAAIALPGARIEGRILGLGAKLSAGDTAWALDAEGATIGGGVFLEGENPSAPGARTIWRLQAEGVNLADAKLGGLVVRHTDLTSSPTGKDVALSADRCIVAGLASLGDQPARDQGAAERDVVVDGAIHLIAAKMGGLRLQNAKVTANLGPALLADRLCVDNSVLITSTNLEARPDGLAPEGALRLPVCDVRGEVVVRDIRLTGGGLILHGAQVGGRLRVEGLRLDDSTPASAVGDDRDGKRVGLDLRDARIAGTLELGRISNQSDTRPAVDYRLDGARAALLSDDLEASWPTAGHLRLDGFAYEALRVVRHGVGAARNKWLALQFPGDFAAQPYEYLAGLLRAHGRDEDADIIAREKRDRDLEHGAHHGIWKLILRFMKGLGHGYSRKRAVLAVGAWWLVGCVWIWIAGLTGGAGFERVHPAFEATRTYELQWWPTDLPFGWRNSIPESREPGARGCPGVDVPIYALELMAPVGDFGQDSDCRLESEGFWAGFVQAWRAFYQIVGAVLIAVFGVAMTGLVRKD